MAQAIEDSGFDELFVSTTHAAQVARLPHPLPFNPAQAESASAPKR
jgi:hypothetical protein